MKHKHILFLITLAVSLWWRPGAVNAVEPSNADYTCVPVFQVTSAQPSILIMMDNSGSMNSPAYGYKNYDPAIDYYGYFEPGAKYAYASNVFTRSATGIWDGNFLNWMCMRRVDVARKVIVGGLAVSRDGSGVQQLIGESPSGYDAVVYTGQSDAWNATPNPGTVFWFYLSGGNFEYWYYDTSTSTWIDVGNYTIRVQKDGSYADEEYNFVNGNLAGIIHKIGTKAEWGLEFFRYGTGTNQSGGHIVDAVDELNTQSMTIDIQNQAANTWTPLAEAYYVAMQYFKQEGVDTTLDYKAGDSTGTDPWEDKVTGVTTKIPCAKGFVILLTDGASTQDQMVPSMYKNYADAWNTSAYNSFMSTHSFSDSGSDYLKDIALYARKNDLRADLEGDQNMVLYPIFAFADTSTTDGQLAEMLLQEAAKNGGYVERDLVDGPTDPAEWDKDGDGVPDTYYRADNGYELEAQLLKAVNAILERAASGTAVSVLSTSGEGEGTISQAFFRPVITDGYYDIQWTGYLQTTWIDSHGNMREDTVADKELNPAEDDIIRHYFDTAAGETKVKRFHVSSSDPYPEIDETTPADEILGLNEIKGLWEAGSMLAQRDPLRRTIYTYIDEDQDGDDEMVSFTSSSATTLAAITPYLGVTDTSTWDYLNTPTVTTEENRAKNLIDYVRGVDMSWLRRRSLDYDGDGDTEAWKLGDIVNSTPVTVASPSENFHHLYGDVSYLDFIKSLAGRETMVYVGANDGMLHAFTSGVYDMVNKKFVKKSGSAEDIGDELWAYVPKNLLPHLKWLPSEDYAHVYYMDAEPRVFSAKIFPDSNGDGDPDWGTVLVAGFNLGGGTISVKADFNLDGDTVDAGDNREFAAAYVAINVTDPRNPSVMWERTYGDLQMSASVPAVMKVGDKWFLTFGSGPYDCDCEDDSTNPGYLYVVDLETGDPHKNGTDDWLFETGESRAFLSSPAALDKGLNNNVDAVYVGQSYFTPSGDLNGDIYKMVIPYTGSMDTYGTDDTKYDSNPSNWDFHKIFTIDSPVTAKPTLSTGTNDNVWIYFGTGRYLNNDDKLDTDDQYQVGFKDPFFNKAHGDSSTFYHDDVFHSYANARNFVLDKGDLLLSNNYNITMVSGVLNVTGPDLKSSTINSFDDLKALVYEHDTGDYASKGKDGWYKVVTGGNRFVINPTVFAGTVFAPSFLPDTDVCSFGGTSLMYLLYYETGTAYGPNEFVDMGEGKSSEVQIVPPPPEEPPFNNVTAISQNSSGEIVQRETRTALGFRSGLKFWQEK